MEKSRPNKHEDMCVQQYVQAPELIAPSTFNVSAVRHQRKGLRVCNHLLLYTTKPKGLGLTSATGKHCCQNFPRRIVNWW